MAVECVLCTLYHQLVAQNVSPVNVRQGSLEKTICIINLNVHSVQRELSSLQSKMKNVNYALQVLFHQLQATI